MSQPLTIPQQQAADRLALRQLLRPTLDRQCSYEAEPISDYRAGGV
jgi:hypothetical protein